MGIRGQHLTESRKATIREAVREAEPNANFAAIAAQFGVSRSTIYDIKREVAHEDKPVNFPSFVVDGDDEEPIEDVIARQRKGFERRQKAADARKWFAVQIPETRPYGLLWFGDPHLDNGGCNWPLLDSHLEVARQPGVYSANIGDTTDSWPWTGRMAKLWAESEVSDKTGKRLAEWFMFDAGVRWLVWLIGNHDEWNGGSEFYKRLGASYVPVIDWRAQFTLEHKSGLPIRVDAAHGRKGSSIYNPSHGTLRAARFGETADLFVSGHTHVFKLDEFEDADRHQTSWLLQCRGYKFDDHFAKTRNFPEYQRGAAILAVIDPKTGVRACFSDPVEGAEYLAYLRNR